MTRSLEQRVEALNSARDENKKRLCNDTWPVLEDYLSSYDWEFYQVLEGKSIKDIVNMKREQDEKVVAIDLMSYGGVLAQLPISRGLAVASQDNRSNKTKEEHKHKNVDILAGDLLSKLIWRNIDDWLNNEKASLILCRPMGGWKTIPVDPNLFYRLAQKVWHRLSPQNGHMLVETPHMTRCCFITEWARLLNNVDGISSKVYEFGGAPAAIYITRDNQAPSILPTFR